MTAWDISGMTYLTSGNLTSLGVSWLSPSSSWFDDTGTKIFVLYGPVGAGASGGLYLFPLSTAWDISSMQSYTQYFSTTDSSESGVSFDTTGNYFYVGTANLDDVFRYYSGAAWNISAAQSSGSISIGGNLTGIFLQPSGSKIFTLDTLTDSVSEWIMNTPFDITTASFVVSGSVTTQENNPLGVFFKDDGTRMYIVGTGSDKVHQYDLSTAWDITTKTYNSISGSVITESPNANDIFISPNGLNIYICDRTTGSNSIRQYSIPNGVSEASSGAYINVADAWREVSKSYVNVADSWREVQKKYVNVGDAWREVVA